MFALAAVTATLFPNGAAVAGTLDGWTPDGVRLGGWVRGPLMVSDDLVAIPDGGPQRLAVPMPIPVPTPAPLP